MTLQFARVFAVVITALVSLAISPFAVYALVRGRPLGWVRRIALAVFSLGVACFFYGLLIEADWLEVSHFTVKTGRWRSGKKLRIAHFSDLHVDRSSRALERLAFEIGQAKPDLIVFSGDALNEASSLKLFRTTLGSMQARLGRVAVRGNHDVTRWRELDLFGGGVATELTRGPVIFEGELLAICGAPYDAFDALPDCVAGAPKGALTVLVFHTPDLVEDLDPRPDLYLSGHTHGGQVALPFYGALLTFSRFDKKYESGAHLVGKTWLNVNRGIGFEPHYPRVRFAARPELSIIDVEGTAAPPPAERPSDLAP